MRFTCILNVRPDVFVKPLITFVTVEKKLTGN